MSGVKCSACIYLNTFYLKHSKQISKEDSYPILNRGLIVQRRKKVAAMFYYSNRQLNTVPTTTRTTTTPSPTTVVSVHSKQDDLKLIVATEDKDDDKYNIAKPKSFSSSFSKDASIFVFPSDVTTAASPFFPLVPPVNAVNKKSSGMSVTSDVFNLEDWSLSGLSKLCPEVVNIQVGHQELQEIIQAVTKSSKTSSGCSSAATGRSTQQPARYLENYASPPSVGIKRERTSNNFSVGLDNSVYLSPPTPSGLREPTVVPSFSLSAVDTSNNNTNNDELELEPLDSSLYQEAELDAIQLCSDVMLLLQEMGSGKMVNRRVDVDANRPLDGYVLYNSLDVTTFLNCFMNVNALFVGVRYFFRHHFPTCRSVVEKQRDISIIFQSIIFFLRNLIAKVRLTRSINSASVVFVTDSRPLYLDLFSEFANHPSWGNFKKGNISTFTVCTKVPSTNDRPLTQQEKMEIQAEQKKLSELETKFRDVSKRYVFVVTNYADTVSLFNNFGNFRQKRFSNMCVISLDL